MNTKVACTLVKVHTGLGPCHGISIALGTYIRANSIEIQIRHLFEFSFCLVLSRLVHVVSCSALPSW